jgi:hypothetical protein
LQAVREGIRFRKVYGLGDGSITVTLRSLTPSQEKAAAFARMQTFSRASSAPSVSF